MRGRISHTQSGFRVLRAFRGFAIASLEELADLLHDAAGRFARDAARRQKFHAGLEAHNLPAARGEIGEALLAVVVLRELVVVQDEYVDVVEPALLDAVHVDEHKIQILCRIDVDGIKQRRLDHLDVLVLNNDKLAKYDYCKKCLADFAARGGKVVGFKSGVKLLPPDGVACKTPCSVVKEIRKLFE